MSERILQNVHIEKTVGTAMSKFFEATLGRDHVAYYDPTTDSLTRSSDLLLPVSSKVVDMFKLRFQPFWPTLKRLWIERQPEKRTTQEIPDGIMVVHGHFQADRFDSVVTDPLRAVLVRDPLARMRSQYDHWKATKGLAEWRVRTPYDPSLSFEQYAMLPQLQNYQTQALAGKDLSEFAVVGVTERLEAYSSALLQTFVDEEFCPMPTGEIAIGFTNRTPRRLRHIPDIMDEAFVQDFRQFHSKDYDLYREALARSSNTYVVHCC
jgi:hypothetical protein